MPRAPRVNGFSFEEAIGIAVGAVEPLGEGADPGPLADYLASDAPLTRHDRQALAHLLRMLPASMPRGSGKARQKVETSATAIARQAKLKFKLYCEQHQCQRLSLDVRKQIIRDIPGGSAMVEEVLRLLIHKARL
jgi:hypothetical protein